MKIRKYLSRKRFSMRQVVGLLMIVFLGVTVLAYAAVSIPHNFTPNTTAKASEVNANFQALANAMPAAWTTSSLAEYDNNTSIYPNGAQVLQLDVNLPSSGKVIVSASGSVCLKNHTVGSTDTVFLKISKTSGAFAGDGAFTHFRVDKAIPTYTDGKECVPLSMSWVFDEATAGATTYYLNMAIDGLTPPTGNVHQVTLSALYVPR